MTFSGHAAVAALSFSLTREPAILIPLNIALHYATDAIPHAEFFFIKSRFGRAATILFDTLITAFLMWLVFIRLDVSPELLGAVFLASFIPDLIDHLTRRFARPVRWFHLLMHTWPLKPGDDVDWSRTVTGSTSVWVKLGIQGILIVTAIAWLVV